MFLMESSRSVGSPSQLSGVLLSLSPLQSGLLFKVINIIEISKTLNDV
jgi:hypothetical protein